MKKLLFSAFLLMLSFSVFAQYGDDDRAFRFGLGGALSLPVGDLKESAVYSVGFNAQASYSFTESVQGFVQTGINVFKGEADYYGESNILHVPIMAGARLNLSGFLVGAGVGYGLYTADGVSSNGFMYSPKVGYDFGNYEVQFNYTGTSVSGGTLSYIGLRAFYKF